jgi:hypothetical protein
MAASAEVAPAAQRLSPAASCRSEHLAGEARRADVARQVLLPGEGGTFGKRRAIRQGTGGRQQLAAKS